jgi:hypothetical protein
VQAFEHLAATKTNGDERREIEQAVAALQQIGDHDVVLQELGSRIAEQLRRTGQTKHRLLSGRTLTSQAHGQTLSTSPDRLHNKLPAVTTRADLTRSPAREGPPPKVAELVNTNDAMADAVQALLDKKSISHDEFWRTARENVHPDLVPGHLSGLIRDDGRGHQRTRSLLRKIRDKLGEQFLPMFIEPNIGLRAKSFIRLASETLRDKPQATPDMVRNAFIQSFPVKVYYRGVKIPPTGEFRSDPHAPAFRQAIAGDRKQLDRFRALIGVFGGHFGLRSVQGVLARVPILDEFIPHVASHLQTYTDGGLLSVSEHPEISWYACCDNGAEQNWKSWPRGTRLRIDRFEMSSYYALDRTEIFSTEYATTTAQYNLDDGSRKFVMSAGAPSIEGFLQVALPQGYDSQPRYFAPSEDRTTFSLPSQDAWTGK